MPPDANAFEALRPELLALAYRMLGDFGRAEDTVQEAWLRWERAQSEVDSPRGLLLTTVTRLCLDELGSARARREESRGDRLPEPVDLAHGALARIELLDQVSMAFLVLLQRLTPDERAVFLLHEAFDLDHGEIAVLLGKSEAACRQLLARARQDVAAERRVLRASSEEHRRLLRAFLDAATSGDRDALLEVLAEDAVLIADPGPERERYGRIRVVRKPVVGRTRIVSLLDALARQPEGLPRDIEERTLNGEPALVAFRDGRAVLAVLVSVAEDKVRHVFLQFDASRLRQVRPTTASS